MKSRIVQTRIWDDDQILEMNKFARYLYIYLLTCSYINICGIFQLANSKIMFETGLTKKDLELAQDDLIRQKKVMFKDGWVCVVNARKNNNYEASELNKIACQKELDKVPCLIREFFDTTIDTSMGVVSILTRNKKQEIRNNNTSNNLVLSTVELQELQEKFPTKSVDQEYEKAQNYLAYTTKKYKDAKRFFNNWLHNSKDTKTPPKPAHRNELPEAKREENLKIIKGLTAKIGRTPWDMENTQG